MIWTFIWYTDTKMSLQLFTNQNAHKKNTKHHHDISSLKKVCANAIHNAYNKIFTFGIPEHRKTNTGDNDTMVFCVWEKACSKCSNWIEGIVVNGEVWAKCLCTSTLSNVNEWDFQRGFILNGHIILNKEGIKSGFGREKHAEVFIHFECHRKWQFIHTSNIPVYCS